MTNSASLALLFALVPIAQNSWIDREGARALATAYGKAIVRKAPQFKRYTPLMDDAIPVLKEGVWFCQMKPKQRSRKTDEDVFTAFFMIAISADSGAFLGSTTSGSTIRWQKQMLVSARKVEAALRAKPLAK